MLQGGDPYGGDTGDAFETTQTPGHAVLSGLSIDTHYDYGTPGNQAGTFITASGGPDTGYVTFTDTTPYEYQGSITLSGLSGAGPFFLNTGAVDLQPGQSVNMLLNDESSNYGGYNPAPAPDAASTSALLGGALAVLAGLRRKFAA